MKLKFGNYSPFMITLFLYILSIEAFSYRSGFVLISYGLCALLTFMGIRRSRLIISNSVLVRYMLIMTLVFSISIIFSVNARNSMLRFVTMTLMLIICVSIELGFREKNSQEVFEFFSKAIIAACIFAFLFDFVMIGPSAYLNNIVNGVRLNSIVSQTNVMGVLGAMTANIMLYRLIYKRELKLLPLFAFPILMILASQSKKAVLCLALGGLILLAIKYRRRKIVGILEILFVLVVLIYLSTLPVFEPIMNRFTNAFTTAKSSSSKEVADWSTYYRIKLIEEGIKFFKEKPILGQGTDCFYLISSYNAYSHNNYIELLACNGIVGFAAYYWVYIYIFIKLVKMTINQNDTRAGLLLCLVITTLLLDYGEVSYYDKMTYIYLSWTLIYIEKRKVECNEYSLSALNRLE